MSYTQEENDLYTDFFNTSRTQLVGVLGSRTGEKIWNEGGRIFDLGQRAQWYVNIFKKLGGDSSGLEEQTKYRFSTAPAPIKEFICDPYFLNKGGAIYPKVMEELIKINSGDWEEIVLTGSIGAAKALALDTPVPTPEGWLTMGGLRTGDVVFNEKGQPCNVLAAHEVLRDKPCYKLTFSDGEVITSCGDHLWRTYTKTQRMNHSGKQNAGRKWGVVSTKEIYNTQDARHAIPIAGPLECVEIRRKSNHKPSHSSWRMVESVVKTASVLVRCITVDSPSSLYLVGESLIATHNTTIAVYTLAYQVYLLSLYRNPHKVFDLDPTSEIQIIFQSVKEALAKEVGYSRFQALLEESPYFEEQFPFDPGIKSKMVFPNRIEVKYVSGSATATLGANVLGGAIDEVNFMEVTQESSKAADGGTYDQAIALYESISRRRKSRFLMGGEQLPGILCLMSSKRYPGQFTDQKMEEAKDPASRIYVYDKRTWDIRPSKYANSKWFQIFIGDNFRKPRILEEGRDLSRTRIRS